MKGKIVEFKHLVARTLVKYPLGKALWNFKHAYTNYRYIHKHAYAQLQEIEIETVNRCNGICPFCPVNVNEPQRPYAKMSAELFEKIVLELSERDFKGKFALYSNNEPLLDERIIDFYRFARSKLPNAFFKLHTNGTLLTLDKFLNLIDYLDCLIIDNYNDDLQVNPYLQEVYDYLKTHTELKSKVRFDFRLQNEVLTSRGGQAPNKKDAKGLYAPCLLPYRQMIVRPTGEVSLCCNDALGKYTLGNLNNNTVWEIWESENFMEIRREMSKNGRKNLSLCRNCDFDTSPMSIQDLRNWV